MRPAAFVCGLWLAALVIVLPTATARLVRRGEDRFKRSVDGDDARNVTRRSCGALPARDCSCSPSVREEVHFPDHIAGRANMDYGINSGYIPVTQQDHLFYIHFGPKNRDPHAPIIFWTNGGPGCSAMEGAFEELGPLSLHKAKERTALYTGQLYDNPYSWNAYAHLVTVDQPRYVGFSYGTGLKIMNSTEAGRDMVSFIQQWFAAYPEVPADTKVYIAGESFAGHYVPGWADEIMNHNARDEGRPINLAGIALGNACVDDRVQIDAAKYREFLRRSNLIPANEMTTSTNAANGIMRSHLGYRPNFYDFRVKHVECNGPCYDYDYTDWQNFLTKPEVAQALHVCPGSGDDAFTGRHGGCIDGYSASTFDNREPNDRSTGHLVRALNADIPVAFYFGKTDLACDYVGGRAMAESLTWKGKAGFNAAPLLDVTIAGASAAQFKQFGNLSWIQIDDAGHMVPADQPAGAFFAINHLLNKELPWSPEPAPAADSTSSAECPDNPTPAPESPTAAPASTVPTGAPWTTSPTNSPASSSPTNPDAAAVCPTCPACDTPDVPAQTQFPSSTQTRFPSPASPSNPPFDAPSLCPTPAPSSVIDAPVTPTMHRVVADTNCVVSCPQCNDADNAGTSEADSQTTLIVGLASGLLVMFCALIIVLVRGCCSNAYAPLSTHGAATQNDVYSNMLGEDMLEDL